MMQASSCGHWQSTMNLIMTSTYSILDGFKTVSNCLAGVAEIQPKN